MINFNDNEYENNKEYIGNSSMFICGAFLAGSNILINNPSVNSFYSSIDDPDNRY